ncbi:MAG: PTS sugar transporter subunit IIA [Erysipelothrix sp.]|nr:PTS sugar transporter subunit IIA [Erysipelothrix sp.]
MKDIIQEKNIVLLDSVPSWEEALIQSSKPLIDNGYIELSYLEAIFKSTEENGPYYVLAPEIAMPHASPQAGVNAQQISLLVLKEPIKFSETGFDVRLVFTLAATDNKSHLESLTRLAEVFADDALIQDLIKQTSAKDVYELIHIKGGSLNE